MPDALRAHTQASEHLPLVVGCRRTWSNTISLKIPLIHAIIETEGNTVRVEQTTSRLRGRHQPHLFIRQFEEILEHFRIRCLPIHQQKKIRVRQHQTCLIIAQELIDVLSDAGNARPYLRALL